MQTHSSKSIAIYCQAATFLTRAPKTGTMWTNCSDSSCDAEDDDSMCPSRHSASDDERRFVPPGGSSDLEKRIQDLEKGIKDMFMLLSGGGLKRKIGKLRKKQRRARIFGWQTSFRQPPEVAPKRQLPPTPQSSSTMHQTISAATKSPGATMSCISDPQAAVLGKACQPTPACPLHIGQTRCRDAATPMARPPRPLTEPPPHIVNKYTIGKAGWQIRPAVPQHLLVPFAPPRLTSDSRRPTGGLTAKSMAIKPEEAKAPSRMPS